MYILWEQKIEEFVGVQICLPDWKLLGGEELKAETGVDRQELDSLSCQFVLFVCFVCVHIFSESSVIFISPSQKGD